MCNIISFCSEESPRDFAQGGNERGGGRRIEEKSEISVRSSRCDWRVPEH